MNSLLTMIMTEEEKTELGLRTFEQFFKQFGDDVHAQILLEEVLRGLIDEEALFIFGEQVEAGDETSDSASERVDCDIPSDRSIRSESPSDLAAEDLSDYP